MRRGTYWVAMCIDLDLVAQASSAAQAQKMLGEQMISYVSEAVGIDQEHISDLLRRRAPLRYFAMYYFNLADAYILCQHHQLAFEIDDRWLDAYLYTQVQKCVMLRIP